jgi:predicted nicotinamide N-methyase
MAYMENPRHFAPGFWAGKHVLELGAGAGIVGILAGLQGASRVVLTDLGCLLPFLSTNISLNQEALSLAGCEAQVCELDWCQPIASQLKEMTFDVILCADCLMSPEVWELLSDVLLQLLSRPVRKGPPMVLLAYEDRFDASRFFDVLRAIGPVI